jgi:hypothetical protein
MATYGTEPANVGFLKKMKIARQVAVIGGIALTGLMLVSSVSIVTNIISNHMNDEQTVFLGARDVALHVDRGILDARRLDRKFTITKQADAIRPTLSLSTPLR